MIHSQSQRFHYHSSIYFHQRNVQFRVEDETLILNEVRRFQSAVNFNAGFSTDDETFIMNEFVLTGQDDDPIRSNGSKLSEETISRLLKTRAYRRAPPGKIQGSAADTCVVCQTEYADGETLGTLECGHEYHAVCLRKWLQQKNACPLCRHPAIQ